MSDQATTSEWQYRCRGCQAKLADVVVDGKVLPRVALCDRCTEAELPAMWREDIQSLNECLERVSKELEETKKDRDEAKRLLGVVHDLVTDAIKGNAHFHTGLVAEYGCAVDAITDIRKRLVEAECERDALREKVASLEAELACAKAFHDVAVKERDAALRLAYIGEHRFPDLSWKARCEEVVQDLRRAERERDTLVRMLASEFDWQDTSYLHAMMHVENAIRNLRADLAVASKTAARCACQWEAGDSPCPMHGEDDE